MRKSILPDDNVIIDMYKEHTVDEIRKFLKTTSQRISEILIKNNIKIKGNFIDIPESDVIEMYLNKNVKVEQICEKYNVSKRKILSIIHKNNIIVRHTILVCEDDIISMYLSGSHTTKQIEEKYNISKSTVLSIIKKYNIKLKSNKLYSCDENIFENIDTEEKSYWLGFLFADGCIINKDKRYYGVKLSLKKEDIKHIEKFRKFMGNDSKIFYNIDKNTKSESYSVTITGKKLVDDLIKHGCIPRKSFIIEFPKLNKDLMRHFIRGYFDGDGTISGISLGFVSGSFDFLKDLSLYLSNELNIRNAKLDGKEENYRTISWRKKDDIIKLCRYMYDDSKISLNRKDIRINYFLDNVDYLMRDRLIKRRLKKLHRLNLSFNS